MKTSSSRLSPEKTLITHAGTEFARFLGYDIGTKSRKHGGDGYVTSTLRLPLQKLAAEDRQVHAEREVDPSDRTPERDRLLDRLDVRQRIPWNRAILCLFAENRSWLWRLHWVMEASLLKTLAAKHKTSVRKMVDGPCGPRLTIEDASSSAWRSSNLDPTRSHW